LRSIIGEPKKVGSKVEREGGIKFEAGAEAERQKKADAQPSWCSMLKICGAFPDLNGDLNGGW
jgi:hypothetical protein